MRRCGERCGRRADAGGLRRTGSGACLCTDQRHPAPRCFRRQAYYRHCRRGQCLAASRVVYKHCPPPQTLNCFPNGTLRSDNISRPKCISIPVITIIYSFPLSQCPRLCGLTLFLTSQAKHISSRVVMPECGLHNSPPLPYTDMNAS